MPHGKLMKTYLKHENKPDVAIALESRFDPLTGSPDDPSETRYTLAVLDDEILACTTKLAELKETRANVAAALKA